MHFFSSIVQRIRGRSVPANLITLVIVSPTGLSFFAKFERTALLDLVRQSISLQARTLKFRIRLFNSDKELDPGLTLEQSGLSNGDTIKWAIADARESENIYAKVFCIGLYKTGTTSLTQALSMLGYKSYHRFGEKFNVDWDDYWYVDDSKAFRHHYRDIKSFVNDYDAFADAPWMYLYRELDQWFPGSKFILTTRDAESLADSEIAQCLRNNTIPDSALRYIDRYNRHNENVLNFFVNRPEDFLVMDVRAGWPHLCDFLDVDIPMLPFPHENKRPDSDTSGDNT